MGDAGDGGGPEDAPGEALPLEDSPPVGVDGHEGGGDVAPPSDGSSLGVPCGDTSCEGAFVCCYGPSPIRCMTPSDCHGLGGSLGGCDGPEDCVPGQVCCAVAQSAGGFALQCEPHVDCIGPIACHPSASVCDCKAATTPCLPVETCEGKCLQ
jgi:hypothetical protein